MSILAESPYAKSDEWRAEESLRKQGSLNPMGKGDDAGYCALHEWVKRRKPKPEFCEVCGERPPFDLANISGEYCRDVEDYLWVCRRDHMIADGRLERLHRINRNWRENQ